MEIRITLIMEKSSNHIQELADGDTLDFTGSGLNLTGNMTLSTYIELNLGGETIMTSKKSGNILLNN